MHASQVISEITDGLDWLASQNPDADVTFAFDIHYRVPIRYEPINRPYHGVFGESIMDAMAYLGYMDPWDVALRGYVNDIRNTLGTDWAYALFVVDSSNDPDGEFADGARAHGYPLWAVMTYDNGLYGIDHMDFVIAHETCHVFYATDEYNGATQTSGYLGVQDNEDSGCMMDTAHSWWLCQASREQLGWRDSDGDSIQDIVDTFPDTTLNPHSPDPTTETILMYTGSTVEVPYPNSNPRGSGRDVTINTIVDVQFRVDYGPWQSATAVGGAFDSYKEDFVFATPPLSLGTHTVEACMHMTYT